jgi:hypothetical protein
MQYNIHLWAVGVAAVASMIVGFVWYSPLLFARPWTVAMGYDPEDKAKMEELRKGAGKTYAITFLLSLIGAFVLAKIISGMSIASVPYGVKVGLAVWAGFIMPVQLTDQMFSRRSFKLFLINTGYQFVCYLAMGAILGRWGTA